MNYKTLIAASLLSLGVATSAFAEGNYEPFPLSVSVGSNGQTYMSQLPITDGLPQGALNGTPRYQQAQSETHWYAQQADHRFAQKQAQRPHTNG